MAQSNIKTEIKMKVAVWDTYVTKKDGSIMHFDIIAPEEIKDTTVIYGYGREYLKTKGQEGQPLTSKECRFCHIETVRPLWEVEIKQKGISLLKWKTVNEESHHKPNGHYGEIIFSLNGAKPKN